MAASDKKLQMYTSFNAGEYSPELAGRVDLESFGSSARFMSNMMSQVAGGVKKFYGTTHITEITPEEHQNKIKFVPFINNYEPMVLVFWGVDTVDDTVSTIKIGLIHGDNYTPLDIEFPTSIDVDEMRWKQINDMIVFVHKSVQPLAIRFYGVDDETGEYVFEAEDIAFDDIPYFPIGTTNDYIGTLEASGLSGTVTLSLPSGATNIRTNFPSPLNNQSTYTRTQEKKDQHSNRVYAVNTSRVYLIRVRAGVETTLCSGVCNSYTTQKKNQNVYYYAKVTDTISREKVLQVIRGTYPQSYMSGKQIVLMGVNDNLSGDTYYLRLNKGSITYGGSTVFPSAITASDPYSPALITTGSLNAESWLGRKIKFFFNDDTVISPWWQGRTISSVGTYVYSDGHWYKSTTTGTCGNIQPSHTFGIRSDGGVTWLYVHSGSNTARVIDVPSSTSVTIQVDSGELPANLDANNKITFNNYAWSIWGYHGVHPSDIYMAGNRLGFICNTDGYGSWNAMSVTDDYFNFATEEYGEQLDTSAIVHLIGNNESGAINWVLSRKNVYMGSFSGEYNIKGPQNVFTPTGTVVENISNMGGKAVIPLKYKELNMFVGITGKELYTIGYDYTIEDYTPHSLGYLTEHLMERGVRRIEALNNLDRNIYLLHDTNQLSLFNYVREQKIMAFSQLDFGAEVLDFATTYSKEIVTAYVATVRNEGKITFERLATQAPTYMFDTIRTGDGTLADFTPISHFAEKDVWIKYGNGQFARARLDDNGDTDIVPQSEYFEVGIPMMSELHTQPAFGSKAEGHQQQSLYISLRLNESGAFDYGSSVDFDKFFKWDVWVDGQVWNSPHNLFTGDATLNIPLGYAENANQGDGPYPNTTGVGVNLRSDKPEPLNILSIQEIYR